MGFMEKQIEFGTWYVVDGDYGFSEIVPADVVGAFDIDSLCAPAEIERMGENWRAVFSPAADVPAALSDYVQSRRAFSIEKRDGWGARLSAPGYLDCTEWDLYDSESEAQEALAEMYDDDDSESAAVNLDCMALADLWAFNSDETNPEALREYAAIKARAMQDREHGLIERALQWERACENLYKQLPQNLRW